MERDMTNNPDTRPVAVSASGHATVTGTIGVVRGLSAVCRGGDAKTYATSVTKSKDNR
jgi:hypothetical protein